MTTTVHWSELTGKEDAPVQEVQGTFPTPCAALKAITERSEQLAFKEEVALEVERLRAECDYWRAKQAAAVPTPQPPTQPPPAPEPAEEPAAHPAPPAEEPQPASSSEDSPQAQGAPTAPAKETVTIESEPEPSSYSALAPQVFGPPTNQMPPEWVQQLLEPPAGEWGTDEDWLTRMLRGEPEPAKRSWSHSDPPAAEPARKGDPVDLFSGRFTLETIDLQVSTPFLPLRLRRCYRSGVPYFGPWGFNWDHNYNQYLRELSDGGIAVWTGQLHETYFRLADTGWAPEPGVHQRLSSPEPGVYELTLRGNVRLRFERPSTWHDPQRIPLVEIADRHGNRQAIEYDGLDRVHRAAEHPRGVDGPPRRWLEFEYGNCGLLEGLRDHAGRQVRYDHHPEIEHLVRVVLPGIGGYPEGLSTEYVYAEDAEHPAVRHDIVGIIDADDLLYLENEYAGPDELWAFNRVVRQRVGDEVFEYGYEQLQYVPRRSEYANLPAVRTTYRPPDGSLHTYTFNYRGNRLDHRVRLNRDGSGRVVIWQWEYDGEGNAVRVVDPGGRTTALTYDDENPDPCARGNLRMVTLLPALPYVDNPRTVLQVDYDPTFQLPTRITDAHGAPTRLDYVGTGKLTAIHPPDVALPAGGTQAGTVTVGLNDQGLLDFVVSALGARHELTRWSGQWEGLPRQLRLDRDDADATMSLAYDDSGFPSQVTDSYGGVTGLAANACGRIEAVRLPEVDAHPAELRFRYGPRGTVVHRATPRGGYADQVVTGSHLIDEIHLDALGRPAEEIVGANAARPRRTRRTHDHCGNVVELTDPAGCVTRNTFDERGLLLEQTAAGATTRFTYELDGRLRRIRYPDGSIRTVEERDAWGRVTRIREPNGALRKLAWSETDRPLESTIIGDPGDGTTRTLAHFRYEYDARDRLFREHASVFEDDPAAAVELTTTYHHDADDRLRRVTTPTAEMTWDYDGLRRVTRYTDPVGNTTRIIRDPADRTIELSVDEVEPGGTRTSTWRLLADERMRVRRLVSPGGHALDLVVDDRDLVIEQHEPLNVVRRFGYGLLGEIEEETVDPGGLAVVTRYEHDELGRLTRLVDPAGAVTTWQRDCLGRPTVIRTPDGGTWRMTYGVSGLAERKLPSGTRQIFTYLPGGLLHTVDCVAAAPLHGVPRHEYGYDGLGRLVRAAMSGVSTVERQFDSIGRLIRETVAGRETRVHHDDLGGHVELRYPDGRVERTTLDAAGRPVKLALQQPGALGGATGTVLAELTYAGTNRLHTIRLANGAESEHGYDEARRLVAVDVRLGSELVESCRYYHDARNRRRLVELTGPPALQRLHTFDDADRLVAVAWGLPLPPPPAGAPTGWTQAMQDQRIATAAAAPPQEGLAYGVGPADDRTSAGQVTYSYAPGHRLSGVGTQPVTHTADGTRTADGIHQYDVDGFGRITAVRDAATGGVLAAYEYDALSRVHKGYFDGATFQRWFLGTDWVHQELAGGAAAQRTMHPWSAMPMEHREAGRAHTFATDGLLNSLVVFNASGEVTERHRFDPFGTPSRFGPGGQGLPGGATLVFGGMPSLETLGLYETPVRLYHPGHGQFLAPDPHGYADSPNPYAYAAHNPVDFADPAGTDKEPRFSELQVQQMWHAAWDSYLDVFYDWPWHAAAWSARLNPLGLVALALGYDPGVPAEWMAAQNPLKFGPPERGDLRPSYEEHRFGSMIFFNALAGVGTGAASGPRIAAEETLHLPPIRGSAGAAYARDTSIFPPPGEFVLLQRGGKHIEALEAQGWWSGHTPRFVGRNVMLWEFRSGGVMFDYAQVDRFGELQELMEFKWDYTGSMFRNDPAVVAALRQQALEQVTRADELGVPVSWTVPDSQLSWFQRSIEPELSSRITWRTYNLAEARKALGF
jgi:RHS repeat-associated protein